MDQLTDKRIVLLVSTLASFLAPFMSSAINIALPAIGKEYNAAAVVLGWLATSYLLAAAMFLLPFGRLADIKGRKKIFTLGLGLYTVASFLCTVAMNVFWFIAFRVIQGLGSTMIFGTGVAMVTSAYPPEERGRALGINVSATYLGLTLGPA
ncbi:MAG: MFS transporter, partial [Spirochaetota bacterium]